MVYKKILEAMVEAYTLATKKKALLKISIGSVRLEVDGWIWRETYSATKDSPWNDQAINEMCKRIFTQVIEQHHDLH